ncbi:hypothetical protein EON73_05235 [bacterium]|nr:MAG: hypothetical protein EON73_05235 [bacterium]
MYYTTTSDFSNFTKAKLLYDQGFNVIDATIQKKDRTFYMFLKDETRHPAQKNLKVVTSSTLTGGYSKPLGTITGDYWAEGPTVTRKDDKWLMYFDKYTLHKYGAITSADLVNWTDVSDQVSLPKGIRHGTVFTVSKTELEKLQAVK